MFFTGGDALKDWDGLGVLRDGDRPLWLYEAKVTLRKTPDGSKEYQAARSRIGRDPETGTDRTDVFRDGQAAVTEVAKAEAKAADQAARDAPPTPVAVYLPVTASVVAPGSVLYTFGDQSTYLATDYFAFDEMLKAMRAGDKQGLEELRSARRLVLLDPETAVTIIDDVPSLTTQVDGFEVRIRSGEHASKKGWTAAEWLRRRAFFTPPKKRRR
jgi:hypothetical protein